MREKNIVVTNFIPNLLSQMIANGEGRELNTVPNVGEYSQIPEIRGN